jgi:Flp pilus assembly protein TadG
VSRAGAPRPQPRHQRGQAIVLIALMLAVLVGMAALAIDGSRAYALRRDLQSALDSSLLAAGDTLQQTGSYASAEQAASTAFGTNLRLYTAPTCSTAYGSPGVSPLTVACTYSDGTVLTQVVSDLGPQGASFSMSATRTLALQFARLLTNGASPTLGARGAAAVNNLLYSPAVAALSPAGCGGVSGTALTVGSGQPLTVIGDVVSNGSITFGSASMRVAGDVYARCQSSLAGLVSQCYPSGAATPCTYPDVAGSLRSGYDLADPNYPNPTVAGGSQGAPGADVVLSPGLYSTDPNVGNTCYFLSSGVYQWQAGFTNAHGFVSNELKPPDEPEAGDNTDLGNQLWNTGSSHCAGSFQLTSVSGPAIARGTWGVEVTSVRSDVYNGVSYLRESAPSMCRTVNINSSQAIQIAISNVPGATSYRVYFDPPPNACTGPFGYGGGVAVSGAVQNTALGPCPQFSGTNCSLGHESAVFDATVLGAGFAPNATAAPGVIGAYPPSDEAPGLGGNLPNQNAARAVPPAGDRANENQCDTLGGALTTCPGPVTPGAVAFYIPSGGCLNATANGDNWIFGGYQYDWLVVYEPGAGHPPANTCSNTLGAHQDSAWIGLVYTPAAGLTVNKAAAFKEESTGGLMAYTVTFTNQAPTIEFDPGYAPLPPASRLVG